MKKILSIALALALMVCCASTAFAVNGSLIVAVGSVNAHAGDTVDVPITVQQNPGIAGVRLFVTYDPDVLTLVESVAGADFPASGFQFGGTLTAIPFGIIWLDAVGTSNHLETGELAVLRFTVADDAPARQTAITMTYDAGSTIDVNLDDVPCEIINGGVTVVPTETGGWSFSEDCTLRLWTGEEKTYVTGMDLDTAEVTGCVETTGGWSYEVECNGADMESTGAVLKIYDETGALAEQYEIVTYGDVNGDGEVTMADAGELIPVVTHMSDVEWERYDLPEDYAYAMASDVNHDGELSMADVGEIIATATYRQSFNQCWMEDGDAPVLYPH